MKRTRILGIIAGVGVAALGLTACAPGGSATSDGPVEITFSSWQFTEPGRGDAFLAIVEEFNQSQDEVIVKTSNTPFADYGDMIKTQIGAGSGPDVLQADYDTFFLLRDSGALLDLTDMLEEPSAGYSSLNEDLAVADGTRYGMMWETVIQAMIVNKDLLDQAGVAVPTTYDEFLAAIAATTDPAAGQFGFAARNTMPQESGWWLDLSTWLYATGGTWTDSSGKPLVDSPEVITVVERFAEVFNQGYLPQGADAATYRRMFWEGKVAIEFDNNALPMSFLAENPSMNIVTAPVPFEADGTIANATLLGMNANTKHPEAAAQFMNYLLTEDAQEALAAVMVGSTLASNMSLSDETLATYPWVQTYVDVAESARVVAPEGMELHTAEFRNAVLVELDKVLRQGKAPADAMRDAQAVVEELTD